MKNIDILKLLMTTLYIIGIVAFIVGVFLFPNSIIISIAVISIVLSLICLVIRETNINRDSVRRPINYHKYYNNDTD